MDHRCAIQCFHGQSVQRWWIGRWRHWKMRTWSVIGQLRDPVREDVEARRVDKKTTCGRVVIFSGMWWEKRKDDEPSLSHAFVSTPFFLSRPLLFFRQTLGLLISACLSSKSRPWHMLLWTEPDKSSILAMSPIMPEIILYVAPVKVARGDSSCLVILFLQFFQIERLVILSIQSWKRRWLLHTQNKHSLTKRDPRRCLFDTLENLTFERIPDTQVLSREVLKEKRCIARCSQWETSFCGSPPTMERYERRTASWMVVLGFRAAVRLERAEQAASFAVWTRSWWFSQVTEHQMVVFDSSMLSAQGSWNRQERERQSHRDQERRGGAPFCRNVQGLR